MRKLKMCWTCSNYIHHEHKYKITAKVCGVMQYIFYRITGYIMSEVEP